MKTLRLLRDPSSDTETTGRLLFGDHALHTIERPWIPTAPGGKPFESCIPAGLYDLVQHTRPSGDKVVCMINPGLGVYRYAEDRPNGVGRYLCLIHVGNYVKDVVGCVAPGLGTAVGMVTQSRKAMSILMDWLDGEDAKLLIEDAYALD